MKYKKTHYILIMILFAVAATISCNRSVDNTAPADTNITVSDTEGIVNIDTLDAALLFENDTIDYNTTTTPEPKTEPTKNKKQTSGTPSYKGKETLYISTYGANGKVWGHVTMNGNTGRGTIHDDDENSYSITVTRHGNELHGTDQNGRLYVFTL